MSLNPDNIASAAFVLIEDQGWEGLSLRHLAIRLGVSPADFFAVVPTKDALLDILWQELDRKAYGIVGEIDPNLSPQERLFEVLMARLEGANPYKKALQQLHGEAHKRPLFLACLVPKGLEVMSASLEQAHVRSSAVDHLLQSPLLAGLFLMVVSTWFDDNTPDMGPTMDALNRGLNRYGSFILKPLSFFNNFSSQK